MPHKELSSTTKSILTLLNNANDLIVVSNRRKEARDVIRALKAYARDKNYPVPEEKIDNFMAVLIDCRPNTLSYLLTDIAQTVVQQQ